MNQDPVTGEDETVTLRIDGERHTFSAAVDGKSGHVTLSPVPERVTQNVGWAVELECQSAESGTYIWGDHTLTDFGTKVVRLTGPHEVESE